MNFLGSSRPYTLRLNEKLGTWHPCDILEECIHFQKISAGLVAVSTYLHCEHCETLRIFWDSVHNKDFEPGSFIPDVFVQNTEPWRSICNSLLHKTSMRLPMVAAMSAICGTVTDLSGATLAFPMTKALCTCEYVWQQTSHYSTAIFTCITEMV